MDATIRIDAARRWLDFNWIASLIRCVLPILIAAGVTACSGSSSPAPDPSAQHGGVAAPAGAAAPAGDQAPAELQLPIDLIAPSAQSNLSAGSGWVDDGQAVVTYDPLADESRIVAKTNDAASGFGTLRYLSSTRVNADRLVRGCVKARGRGVVQIRMLSMTPSSAVPIGAATRIDLLDDQAERCYKVHSVPGPGTPVALEISAIAVPVELLVKSATLQVAPAQFAVHSTLITAPANGGYQVIGPPNPGQATLGFSDPSSTVAGSYFDSSGNGACTVIPHGARPPSTPTNAGYAANRANSAESNGAGGSDGKNCPIPWNAFTSITWNRTAPDPITTARTTQDIQLVSAESAAMPKGLFGRSGRVVQFYAERGDTWEFGPSTNRQLINYPRTELSAFMRSSVDGTDAFHFRPGKTYRILTSYFLPANDTDYAIDSAQDELHLDVHHPCELGGEQTLQRLITTTGSDERGSALWQVRSAPKLFTREQCLDPGFKPPGLLERRFYVMDVKGSRGRWIDIDIEYRPAVDSDGRLIIKEDGCTVVSLIGIPNSFAMTYPDGPQAGIATHGSLQIGLYKWDWNKGLTVPPGVLATAFTPGVGISTVSRRKFYVGPVLMGAKPCGGAGDPLCNR